MIGEYLRGSDGGPYRDESLNWRFLVVVNVFRGGLALSLLGIFLLQPHPPDLATLQPRLFLAAVIAALAVTGTAAWTLYRRWPPLAVQGPVQLTADVAIYLAFVQASGGLETGLGNLIFIPVAAASLVLGQRTAIALAALASLALLVQQGLMTLYFTDFQPRFTHAGILGAVFMTTALVGAQLAERLRASEALAARRGLDLRNLAELNDYIIHHLRTGIAVIDPDDRVQLMNGAAGQFLGVRVRLRGRPVAEVSPRLAELLSSYRDAPWERPISFTAADGETVVAPRFTELGPRDRPGVLVFLEDSSLVGQRAQELKLAALGRFTASIAHEIRNPLGAISHANQLLSESPRLSAEDARMTDIISRHVDRVDRIVETVLRLSRRETTEPRPLQLGEWLPAFRDELTENDRLPPGGLRLELPPGGVTVRMDPNHLYQILGNLVDNALSHGDSEEIVLRAGFMDGGRRPYLDVIDFGVGIPGEEAERVFEPFYTASTRGTGLGLFIARELCESNRARIDYRREEGGTCFRIRFADPERWLT
jgi:two-component system sensor histidine kinase PilS (NtrC family)